LWYRGFFDGDGCVYLNEKQYLRQLSFSATFNYDWRFLIYLFEGLDVKWRVQNRVDALGHKHSSIRVCDTKSIQRFAAYLYSRYPEIGFKRKRDNMCKILMEVWS
jgi:intein-encoded DNA endonuclease-like protein